MDRKGIPKRVVVGVSGGIAAYKACTVVRQLAEAGHEVRVIPTESALRFVGAATFEALSGQPVHTDVFADVPEVPHVRLGQQADLVVVAPATADLLARAVAGRADDLLTATLLTARCPVMFAPAMHTEMWLHPATVDNVATLRRRGAVVLEPAFGGSPAPTAGPAGYPRPRRSPPWPTAAGAPRRAALRPGRPQGPGDRRRHPRGDRSGALHRQPQLGQAGLCGSAGRRPARRPGHADRRAHRGPHRPGRRRRGARQLGRATAGTRCPSTPRTRTCW